MPRVPEHFYFDGEDSRDYGIWMTSQIQVEGAKPNVETVTVPGRSGDLLIYDGSYGNVSFTASCFVTDTRNASAQDNLTEAVRWLTKTNGYRRLQLPGEDGYRMAYVSAFPGSAWKGKGARSFSIIFQCKPQIWMYEGEQQFTLSASGVLFNPGMPALPLIRVYGSGAGTVTVGDTTVTLSAIDEYVTLDSDIQDAYKGTANKNSTISAAEFPKLEPGENPISFGGGVTKLQITPRWWHL